MLILLIIVFFSFSAFSQTKISNWYIRPIVGIKLHDNQEPAISFGNPKILSSSTLGLEVGRKDFPLKVNYQYNFNLTFWNYVPNWDEEWNIHIIREEEQINLYWRFKFFSVGLGHYWSKTENHLTRLPTHLDKGVQISLSYPAQWLDIELRTSVQYEDYFAAIFGSSLYSVSFLYRIGAQPNEFNKIDFLTVNGIIGARAFPITITPITGEKFNKPFGIAPGLGVEFLVNKINLSLNLEKDWWLSFNAGSHYRDLKGLIYSSFAGVKYHHLLKNGRHLRYGFGGSWIEDNENKIKNTTPNPTPEQLKLGNYQVKGFAISVSYEILPNTDIELKTTLPLLGEDIFENPSRTSIGLFYRYNPFRKKGG